MIDENLSFKPHIDAEVGFLHEQIMFFFHSEEKAAATLPSWVMVTSFIREPLFTLLIFGFCLSPKTGCKPLTHHCTLVLIGLTQDGSLF